MYISSTCIVITPYLTVIYIINNNTHTPHNSLLKTYYASTINTKVIIMTPYSLLRDSVGLEKVTSGVENAFPLINEPMVVNRSLRSSIGLLPWTFLYR